MWLEEVLGFKLRGNTLAIDPVIPRGWAGFHLRFRYKSTKYEIAIENPAHVCRGVILVELDGVPILSKTILLSDDNQPHTLRVRLGPHSGPEGVQVASPP